MRVKKGARKTNTESITEFSNTKYDCLFNNMGHLRSFSDSVSLWAIHLRLSMREAFIYQLLCPVLMQSYTSLCKTGQLQQREAKMLTTMLAQLV